MPNTLTRRMRDAIRDSDVRAAHLLVRLSLVDNVSPMLRTLIAEDAEHVAKRAADDAVSDAMAFAQTRGEYVMGGMQRDEDAVVARMRELLGTPRPRQNVRSPERELMRQLSAQQAVDVAIGYVECSGRKVVGRHRERVPVRNVWYTAEECHVNGWIVNNTSRHLGWESDVPRDMYRLRDNRTLIDQCAYFWVHPDVPAELEEFAARHRCQRDAKGPGERFCELHAEWAR